MQVQQEKTQATQAFTHSFIHSFTHPSTKRLLNTYYIPGTTGT